MAAGTAARTLQQFLVTAKWEHAIARDRLQQRVADAWATNRPTRSGW